MSKLGRKLFLMFTIALTAVLLPIAHFTHTGKWLPPGFGVFPPQQIAGTPKFNLTIFIVLAIPCVIVLAFLIFPSWFGFKKVSSTSTPGDKKNEKANFPAWFWPGVVLNIVSWIIMWGNWDNVPWLKSISHFTFVPLWLGYILALDGLVYRRTGGASLIASKPKTMLLITVTSAFFWAPYEYFDYFALGDWYYPNNKIFSTAGYVVWYALCYTSVLPSVFEWYSLLNTFDVMKKRYANGPKLAFSRRVLWLLYVIGLLLIFGAGYWPYPFFFAFWLAPYLSITASLMLVDLWTPIVPFAKGNWTAATLMTLACLFNYLLGEMWNFGSRGNPSHWKYDIPYVNGPHFFSEMPILGYFGYMPFALLCWVTWLMISYLCGWNPDIHLEERS